MTFRTHRAAEIVALEGQSVTLAGWVARRRDHGGITFIDLRDASGIVQVVADGLATDELRMEYCIPVTGTVRPRPEGTVNPDLATGAVEVAADAIEILSPSDPLPFMLDDRVDADETTRLEYRYLDLRRPRMAANLRGSIAGSVRHPTNPRRLGLSRGGDADPGPFDSRGCPRCPRALSVAAGFVLCAAPVAAALQTAADDLRGRALLPDRPLLSRRGLPRRSPDRVHPARPRRRLLGRGGGADNDRSDHRRGGQGPPGHRP